jgi:hypothetical protein
MKDEKKGAHFVTLYVNDHLLLTLKLFVLELIDFFHAHQ